MSRFCVRFQLQPSQHHIERVVEAATYNDAERIAGEELRDVGAIAWTEHAPNAVQIRRITP